MSAKIIVIDGGANIGKATQADMLMNRLMNEGSQVGKMDFPRYNQNTLGRLVSECLRGECGDLATMNPKVIATLFAADRFESKKEIETWMAEGRTIIFDRYVTSNMLHQGARILDLDAREEFFKWVDHIEHDIFGIPKPNLTIYLDVPPDDSHKLLEYVEQIGGTVTDPQEQDKLHQAKVTECARYLSSTYRPWVTLQSMTDDGVLRSREDIHEDVYRVVKEQLG